MAGTVPNSTIKLYDIPDSDVTAGTVFLFDNETDRDNFFGNYLVAKDVKCTVVKKSYQTLRVSVPLETAERCNYISFVNPDFGNKVYFGVILNTDYLNNNTSVVTYEIDWWYTDMFNVKAQVSQMSREGLTNKEYPTDMMTNGGDYFDDRGFIEKMTSAEPLACDTSTEQANYSFAKPGDMNDYSSDMVQVIRDNNPSAYTGAYQSQQNLTGICFVSPDFDKLDHEEGGTFNPNGYTKAFQTLMDELRDGNYFVKLPFNAYTAADPAFGTSLRWDAFMLDSNQHTIHNLGSTATGYSNLVTAIGEPPKFAFYEDTNAIGSRMKTAYCIVIAQNDQVHKIIDFLTSLDMSSSILAVHMITNEIFAMLCGDEITYNNSQYILTRNKCSRGMYFPQTRRKKKSGNLNGISPKLMFYPYSYMTLSTNDGNNNMEYRYEYMLYNKDDKDHDFAIHMFAKYDSDGPAIICAPEGYRQRYIIPEVGVPSPHHTYSVYEVNPEESVGDNNYPQIPYTTDSWLAGIASKSNELIKQNTTEFQNSIGAEYTRGMAAQEMADFNQDYQLWGNLLSATGSLLSLDFGDAVNSAINAYTSTITAPAEFEAKKFENANTRLKDSMVRNAKRSKGIVKGNPVYENFKNTISAYAQPNFHSGTSLRPGMINNVGEKYIYAVFHSLKEAIFNVYNNFFKRFGYATKQLKIPAVFELLYNASGTAWGNDLKPRFDSVDFYDYRTKGHTTPGQTNGYARDVFYTQTDNLKVTGVNKTSEEFIRKLFDLGCLFIRPLTAELDTPVEPTPTPITPAPYVPPTPVPTPTPTPTPVATLTFITNPNNMIFDSTNTVWVINQSARAEGGTTPYTYAWKIKLSNNEIIDLDINSSVCAFAITSRDTLMTYDGAELYNTVTDADGNTADSAKATITVVSPEPPEPTPTEPTPTEPTPTEPTPTEPTPAPTGVEFTTVSIDASSGARAVAVIRASVSGVDYSTDKYYSDMYFPGVGSNPGYWINGSYAMTFYSFYNYECRATQYCSPSEVVSKVRLRIEKDGNTYTSDEYIIDRTITWDTPVVATPAGAASNIKAVTVSNIANVSDGATIQFVGKPVGGENFTQVYGPVTITGGSATSGNIDTDNVESVCFVIVNGNNFVGSGEISLT